MNFVKEKYKIQEIIKILKANKEIDEENMENIQDLLPSKFSYETKRVMSTLMVSSYKTGGKLLNRFGETPSFYQVAGMLGVPAYDCDTILVNLLYQGYIHKDEDGAFYIKEIYSAAPKKKATELKQRNKYGK